MGRKENGLSGLEVCDPVEANYYKIGGVMVSDFVRPESFEPEHQKGQLKMDYTRGSEKQNCSAFGAEVTREN